MKHNKHTTKLISLSLFASLLFLAACHGDYTPKPKAYPMVTFPKHEYDLYDPKDCPFKFEKPVYSSVVSDSTFFGQKNFEPCWLTVNIAPFNGTINLTYKEISPTLPLEKLLEDAHKLSYKHTRKADYINEIGIDNKHGVSGLLYDVGGDAASNVQFFLTDSNKHFIRGALYFNNAPNTDSMAPVINFVKVDLKHFLETFEWK
jgi:gliding motility-associated lipoprotein GldD